MRRFFIFCHPLSSGKTQLLTLGPLAFPLLLSGAVGTSERTVAFTAPRCAFDPMGRRMNEEQHRYRDALESQLGHLRGRLEGPDASHWEQMGKWAMDFDLWLERARPWISCASQLISLRVEQILKGFKPAARSEVDRRKFANLLEEAEKQLSKPGSAIQILDLGCRDDEGRSSAGPANRGLGARLAEREALLPFGLVEIPEHLQPEGSPPVQFRYIIPN